MDKTMVTIAVTTEQVSLLATAGTDELMRAVLPAEVAIRRKDALPTLLEGLSKLTDQNLCVAVYVADRDDSLFVGLSDMFGFGEKTLYYHVDHVLPAYRRRGRRLRLRRRSDPFRQLALLHRTARCGGY